jgi:RHS repeat-associated protein
VLQPRKITDRNNNYSQVAFDALGMVVGTAVWGMDKDGNPVGDSLNGFEADLEQQQIDDYLSDPLTNPVALLKMASTRLIYDLHRYMRTGEPNVVYTMARETHAKSPGGDNSRIQHSFVYSDGFGREVQTKVQAEPDPALPNVPRWVGTGTTIYNNKGKAVEQYEPFFSSDHLYKIEKEGVSPVLFYDPLERVVCTVHPNHTYEKVVFDAWRQETWDANDTIHSTFRFDPQSPGNLPEHTFNPADDPDVGFYFRRLPAERYLPTWYDLRMDSSKALEKWPVTDENGAPLPDKQKKRNEEIRAAERRAAEEAAKHAATPALSHLDTLGRTFLSIADNGKNQNGNDVHFTARVELDIEGNDIRITDPREITAFEHVFDLGGRKLRVESKDAGVRFDLPDISGENPWYMWDANGNEIKTEYDSLRRPVKVWVKQNGTNRLVNLTQYGDEAGITDAQRHNLRGQVYRVLDDAGEVINTNYDFKGNILTVQRTLLEGYKLEVDWNSATLPAFETDASGDPVSYSATDVYDALNRLTSSAAPDGSVHKLTYNEANFLETVKVRLSGETDDRDFITKIEYDAKGQREKITYCNGVTTDYSYDPETFRLMTIVSRKPNGKSIQNLRYTYDPVGNVTQIHDASFHTVFNHNQRVDPINRYKYDPIYRLIEASGREHGSMTACHYQKKDKKHTEFIHLSDQPINNGQDLYNYTQTYQYDANGNITRIRHVGRNGWTRNQEYDDASNRLKTSKAGCRNESAFDYLNNHDENGNIERMPHLNEMKWDYANRLIEVETSIQTNATNDRAYYQYDVGGQRVRKVIEQGNSRVEERIYVGGYEVFRKYDSAGTTFERSTLHVMDDKRRIALIETKTKDNSDPGSVPEVRVRYQLDNHLGSSLLEVDEDAREISYEEYYPYGGTAYLAGKNWAEVKQKRYRYSGKERDEETGLYYYGARYFAPWLGRWCSTDPMGIADVLNLYKYARNNPTFFGDPTGTHGEPIDLSNINTDPGEVPLEINPETGRLQITVNLSENTEALSPKEGNAAQSEGIEFDLSAAEKAKLMEIPGGEFNLHGGSSYDPPALQVDPPPSTIVGNPLKPYKHTGVIYTGNQCIPDERYVLDPLLKVPILRPGEKARDEAILSSDIPTPGAPEYINPDDIRPEIGVLSKNEVMRFVKTGDAIANSGPMAMITYFKHGEALDKAADLAAASWGLASIGAYSGGRGPNTAGKGGFRAPGDRRLASDQLIKDMNKTMIPAHKTNQQPFRTNYNPDNPVGREWYYNRNMKTEYPR